tara:strand:- start:1248 stop:1739 length:492 start_codon:yes stop_codon:yes gene_type:complete
MKSLVVYYSHYGNTAKVIHKIFEYLRQLGEAQLNRLEYLEGKSNPLKRLIFKIFPNLVELAPIPIDLSEYDLLCIGIPVLGGLPSSIISKYLRVCKSIDKKKIICCYVYGFEINAKGCSDYVKKLLTKKENPDIIEMFMSWSEISKPNYVDNKIKEALAKVST